MNNINYANESMKDLICVKRYTSNESGIQLPLCNQTMVF